MNRLTRNVLTETSPMYELGEWADNEEDKSAENVGSYNLVKIYYILTPDKEKIEVNKEFNLE